MGGNDYIYVYYGTHVPMKFPQQIIKKKQGLSHGHTDLTAS